MPAPAEAKTWAKVGTYPGKKDIEEMLKGNSGFDAIVVEKFFTTLVYPHFTRSENFLDFPHRTDLPKMRKTCRDYFNYAGKNPPAHEKLNEITVKFMDDVAQDNYDPAARANAMLMIADLSETDPNGKPWKNSLPALLKGDYSPNFDRCGARAGPARLGAAGAGGNRYVGSSAGNDHDVGARQGANSAGRAHAPMRTIGSAAAQSTCWWRWANPAKTAPCSMQCKN